MSRTVGALRALWVALMVMLGVLMWNNLISAGGTALYSVLVLAVMFTEQYLARKSSRAAHRL
jgi:hypothetical protein